MPYQSSENDFTYKNGASLLVFLSSVWFLIWSIWLLLNKDTLSCCVKIVISVHDIMDYKTVSFCYKLITVIALLWFLVSVLSYVSFKITFQWKYRHILYNDTFVLQFVCIYLLNSLICINNSSNLLNLYSFSYAVII